MTTKTPIYRPRYIQDVSGQVFVVVD